MTVVEEAVQSTDSDEAVPSPGGEHADETKGDQSSRAASGITCVSPI